MAQVSFWLAWVGYGCSRLRALQRKPCKGILVSVPGYILCVLQTKHLSELGRSFISLSFHKRLRLLDGAGFLYSDIRNL